MITQFNDELSAVATTLRQSTVKVKSGAAKVGSGVIWKPDGLIITNAHVATSAHLTVELFNGRVFEAVRSHFDPQQDLAALKINATDLKTATIGDSDKLRVGELVLAVGNPFADTGAATIGIVHTHHSQAVISDLQLYPGNSGGPLADCLGRVVGINTMIVNNLAVAIPSTTVNRFLRGGHPLQLGVILQPIIFSRRSFGLLVLSILPGSVAENLGLQIGDVLVGVAGKTLTRPGDLAKYLHPTHKSIPLQILRNGQQFVVYITGKTAVEAT